MKVSVALCTYNSERYLSQQLDSILKQNRPVDEIVVCDDGSTDKTMEILQGYQYRNPSIRVEKNPHNLGYVKNFEKAIGLTSGDWVFLSDHDDLWLPEKVAHYLQIIENSTSRLGLVFGNAVLVDEEGTSLGLDLYGLVMKKKFGNKDRLIQSNQALAILDSGNFVTGATVALRRSSMGMALPFPSRFVHDYWLTMVFSMGGLDLYYVSKSLTFYRRHEGQTVGIPIGSPEHAPSPKSKAIDPELMRSDTVFRKHFDAMPNRLSPGGRKLLRKFSKRKTAYYNLKLHERILQFPKSERAAWVTKYLLTGRYSSWESRRPKILFELAHALFDCLRSGD